MTTTSTHPRDRLIHTAAALVQKQGWTATGINQILSDANIPKGSFYYYFRSKEALGAAVLQLHYSTTRLILEKTLLNAELRADAALDEFFRQLTEMHRESGFKLGCPAGSFANEIANQSVMLLAEANKTLALYEEAFTAAISRGQKASLISPDADPAQLGKVAAMFLQGALLAMKCATSSAPLDLAHGAIQALIFGTTKIGVRPAATDFPKLQALAS